MLKLKPLYQLYKGLKANNYDVPDTYDSFERTLCASGKEGAQNRRNLHKALVRQNYDVPSEYTRFYQTLFTPVSRDTSIAIGSPKPKKPAPPKAQMPVQKPAPKAPAQPKGTPMTAAQKQAAVQNVNDMVAGVQAGAERVKNQMDYARGTAGLKTDPPRLGQQATVVRRDAKGKVKKDPPQDTGLPALDPKLTGDTYLTEAGNEYTDRTQAENEQGQIERQQKEWEANQDREAKLRKQRQEVVDKMMARAEELNDEALQFSWRDMPRGSGGAIHTWNSSSSNGRYFDNQYQLYQAQLDQIDDALAAIEEGKQGRASDAWINSSSNWFERKGKQLLAFGAGAVRGLSHAVRKVSTWDMGMTDAATNAAMLDAARAAKKKGFAHIDPEQQRLLNLAALNQTVRSENAPYIGYGYDAGEITGTSLPFIIEMLANPASKIGPKAAQALSKYAIKRFGKAAVKRAMKKYAAAKMATRVVGDIVGSAVMAGTTGQGRVMADTLRRMTGDVKYKPKSVIRISLCRTAKRNPLIFPI